MKSRDMKMRLRLRLRYEPQLELLNLDWTKPDAVSVRARASQEEEECQVSNAKATSAQRVNSFHFNFIFLSSLSMSLTRSNTGLKANRVRCFCRYVKPQNILITRALTNTKFHHGRCLNPWRNTGAWILSSFSATIEPTDATGNWLSKHETRTGKPCGGVSNGLDFDVRSVAGEEAREKMVRTCNFGRPDRASTNPSHMGN